MLFRAPTHSVEEQFRATLDQLALEREFSDAVLNTIGALVIVADRERRILRFNPACEVATQYTAAEVVGRKWDDLFLAPEDKAAVMQIWDSLCAGDFPNTNENCWLAKDGSRRIISWSNTVMVDDKGQIQFLVGTGIDITDRVRMERANRDWHSRLKLAQDAGLRIGFWDWDIDSNRVTWSEERDRQFGFSPGEFSGRPEDALPRIHPEDQPRVAEAIERVLKQGVSEYAAQYRTVRPDGSMSWINTHGVLLKGSDRMLGISLDITDLKNAEQHRKDAEQRYLLLLNSTAEAIYGLDPGGNCTFCNPACARLFGYESPQQLLGKNMHAVAHHSWADGSPYAIEDCQVYVAFRNGTASHVTDEVFWRADGTSFPVEYWSYPMWKDGSIIGSVVTFLDISDRKKAEQALRQSEEKYRELFENAPYGIFRSAPEGTLLDVNQAMVAMLGYSSKDELLSSNLNTDVYRDAAQRKAAVQTCHETGRAQGIEVDWKRRDGKVIQVRMSGRLITEANQNKGCMEVIVEDITARRALEQQLRQVQKLEAIGTLAGGVAHDFNNLIQAINGSAELALRKNPGEPTARHLKTILNAGAKAAAVTAHLLAFSRKQVLAPEVISLNEQVDETVKLVRRLIREDIELMIGLDPQLPAVRVDKSQLSQVIINLCVNACDAMPTGGLLRITTSSRSLQSQAEADSHGLYCGTYACLEVSDNGIGMTEDVKTHIFEPFFTTKPVGQGTGLGLATVYGIVQQSGGSIVVESAPGTGTTFRILLPTTSDPLPRETDQPVMSGGEGTVLLVEDEDTLRSVLEEQLRSLGYRVLIARSGTEALMMPDSTQQRIDLLLADVVMPGMNGIAVFQALQKQWPDLKAIFMSGYTDDVVIRRGVEANDIKLLKKPFTVSTLSSKVAEIMRTGKGACDTRSADALAND